MFLNTRVLLQTHSGSEKACGKGTITSCPCAHARIYLRDSNLQQHEVSNQPVIFGSRVKGLESRIAEQTGTSLLSHSY